VRKPAGEDACATPVPTAFNRGQFQDAPLRWHLGVNHTNSVETNEFQNLFIVYQSFSID
jgi:hypothetical protein